MLGMARLRRSPAVPMDVALRRRQRAREIPATASSTAGQSDAFAEHGTAVGGLGGFGAGTLWRADVYFTSIGPAEYSGHVGAHDPEHGGARGVRQGRPLGRQPQRLSLRQCVSRPAQSSCSGSSTQCRRAASSRRWPASCGSGSDGVSACSWATPPLGTTATHSRSLVSSCTSASNGSR